MSKHTGKLFQFSDHVIKGPKWRNELHDKYLWQREITRLEVEHEVSKYKLRLLKIILVLYLVGISIGILFLMT